MKTYTANFTTESGCSLMNPIKDTNKARIAKDIKALANRCIYLGESYRYEIWEENGVHPEIEGGRTGGGKYWQNNW